MALRKGQQSERLLQAFLDWYEREMPSEHKLVLQHRMQEGILRKGYKAKNLSESEAIEFAARAMRLYLFDVT